MCTYYITANIDFFLFYERFVQEYVSHVAHMQESCLLPHCYTPLSAKIDFYESFVQSYYTLRADKGVKGRERGVDGRGRQRKDAGGVWWGWECSTSGRRYINIDMSARM